jgi:D-Tyr-tRNAtyr deacylase
MKALIQRVSKAKVEVDGQIVGKTPLATVAWVSLMLLKK